MKKIISEFKEFAIKGNMLDLAVGVIIGAAFKSIVDSIVNDILMPVVGVLIGGTDFSALSVDVGGASIKYGMLVQNVVNFFIVAVCLFALVKSVNMLKRKKPEDEAEEKPDEKPADIILLEEIRDAIVSAKE